MKRIIFACFMLLSAVTLFCEEIETDIPVIAVLDFETDGVSKKEMQTIISRLSSGLFQTKKFTVIGIDERAAALEEISFHLSDASTDKQEIQIGKMLSAEMIVTGSIGRVEGKYLISIQLIQTDTTETISTADGTYESLDALTDNIYSLARVLAGLDPNKPNWLATLSTQDVIGVSAMGVGTAAVITGGVFFLKGQINDLEAYREAEKTYNNLSIAAPQEDYDKAAALAESTRQTYVESIITGAVISGAGLITTAAGAFLYWWPEREKPEKKQSEKDTKISLLSSPGEDSAGFRYSIGLCIKY